MRTRRRRFRCRRAGHCSDSAAVGLSPRLTTWLAISLVATHSLHLVLFDTNSRHLVLFDTDSLHLVLFDACRLTEMQARGVAFRSAEERHGVVLTHLTAVANAALSDLSEGGAPPSHERVDLAAIIDATVAASRQRLPAL